MKTTDIDCFYISFDEPNKEHNWAQLQRLVPWSQRVDGVIGFDAAHKACADLSETDYLITIDGDNVVFPEFFELDLYIPHNITDCVLSWNSINAINGLCYGNGGVKIWPRQFLLDMCSHENATNPQHAVDFCWTDKYIQLANIYSTTFPNGSAEQAFRAGFREGVKMTLDRGLPTAPSDLLATCHPLNLKRLQVWGSIGADAVNGQWAIFGTRVGTHYAMVEQADIKLVADYVELNQFVRQFAAMSSTKVARMIKQVTNEVKEATGLEFVDFTAEQSKFVKDNVNWYKNNPNPLLGE